MSLPSNISGFTVLPVLYSSTVTHYLYIRAHSSSSKPRAEGSTNQKDVLPSGRTLFLVNVPPDATERELVLFFKHAGTVEKVLFDFEGTDHNGEELDSDEEDQDIEMNDSEEDSDAGSEHRKGRKKKQDDKPKVIPLPAPNPPIRKLRKTGQSAHIVFLDASSLERALASTSKPRSWPLQLQSTSKSTEEPIGLAHYRAVYASLRPSLESVQAFADSSMEVYEYNLAKDKQKSKYKKGEAIVDEDGFTLVTRGGAYGKTLGGGVGVASKKFQRSAGQSRTRNRGDKKAKDGFYAFQKAEKQRSELMELKRKWEEDKAKVEKLKASRRFRPY
ncbi:ribosomal RNA-processing protein 7-domain-containing protein, partial [Crepidotus variabilis]